MKGQSALEMAEKLLHQFESLDRLARAGVKDLARVKGIGATKAVQLKAAFALGARYAETLAFEQPVETPEQVERLLGASLRQLSHETLRVLTVNTRLRLIACEEVSRGTINETVAHPRDILRSALLHQAYGVILVHNHPAGDPRPSAADHAFTLRMREAARLMQIEFLDHIILGTPAEGRNKSYFSFKEEGHL